MALELNYILSGLFRHDLYVMHIHSCNVQYSLMFLMDLQSYATILHHAAFLFLEYFIFFSKSPMPFYYLSLPPCGSRTETRRRCSSCFCRLAFCSCFTQRKLCNTWSLVLGSLTCFHALSFIRTRVLSPKNPPLRDFIIFLYSWPTSRPLGLFLPLKRVIN